MDRHSVAILNLGSPSHHLNPYPSLAGGAWTDSGSLVLSSTLTIAADATLVASDDSTIEVELRFLRVVFAGNPVGGRYLATHNSQTFWRVIACLDNNRPALRVGCLWWMGRLSSPGRVLRRRSACRRWSTGTSALAPGRWPLLRPSPVTLPW